MLCSGKVYYQLLARRDKSKVDDIILVRIEQVFPLDVVRIKDIIRKYNAKELLWVQEEPENMGAWTFILSQLRDVDISVIARNPSAATATGSSKRSVEQQNEIIDKVFKR